MEATCIYPVVLVVGQLEWVGGQAGRQVGSETKIFKIQQLQFSKLNCLNRFMMLIAWYKEIYGLYLKEMLL